MEELVVNPLNVEYPQSLRHMQPIYKFTVTDTRNNLAVAMFHAGSPCGQDVEDAMHRRCVLLHGRLGEQMEVALVKNPNPRRHRAKPPTLSKDYQVRI